MDETFVSLDLETTGLDPDTDRIIEIGAVKFRGDEVLGTFHSLINPYRSLPYHICRLTGIMAQELEGAPPFDAVSSDLFSFTKDCSIVGQNIGFDLSFLSVQGLKLAGPSYDTLELARIILPQSPDHSLSTLAKELSVDMPTHHRALDDAVTAKDVFLALLDRASHLPPHVIAEIVRLTINTEWVWHPLFADINDASLHRPTNDSRIRSGQPAFATNSSIGSLVTNASPQPLDVDQLTQLLGDNGPMASSFPSFECRPGQVAMMRAVAQLLNTGGSLIAEAGTGTGKSVAYLLPAILFSVQNRTHMVLSTNTINLQDQLVHKDIPHLLQVLSLPECPGVAQLKGRANYLCLKQWDSCRQTPGTTWEETKFMLRLVVWLSSTSTGDRAELNIHRNDMAFWNRVCALEENCTPNTCSYRGSKCYLYEARRKAEASHIVVVNHALLLSDLVNMSKVLPEYQHLIIDEAHHLEEEATRQLGYEVKQWNFYVYLDRIGEKNGVLVHLQNWLRRSSLSIRRCRETEEVLSVLLEQGNVARQQVSGFFAQLTSFLQHKMPGVGQYEQHLRLVSKVRCEQDWEKVEAAWANLNLQLSGMEYGLTNLYSMLESLTNGEDHTLSNLHEDLLTLKQRGQKLRHQTNSIVASPEENRIDWASLREGHEALLHTAPLHVGEALDEQLFSQKHCVVLTSATMSTAGNFEYTKDSLGLRSAQELLVDSPFDYRKSALIYLPSGVPAPRDHQYQSVVAQSMVELCRAVQGRTLVLFTSHASLRATYPTLKSELEKENILILGQGIDGSPKQLLNMFRTNPKTVLLGTASLWEGIDVAGDTLSVVVITKLPFSVPSDPVFSARGELFDDPFKQYAVPQAILKFKQGFGRLIRSKEDHGAMVILDARLQTKSYGKTFLESLPACTIVNEPLRQMSDKVRRWLSNTDDKA